MALTVVTLSLTLAMSMNPRGPHLSYKFIVQNLFMETSYLTKLAPEDKLLDPWKLVPGDKLLDPWKLVHLTDMRSQLISPFYIHHIYTHIICMFKHIYTTFKHNSIS